MSNFLNTCLYSVHMSCGANMTQFAGYNLPVSYGSIVSESIHTRSNVSIFDVSHMGKFYFEVDPGVLENLVPADIHNLPIGRQKYTQLTNEKGGIIDDLIITRLTDKKFHIVINAAGKERNIQHIEEVLKVAAEPDNRALIAVQGPKASKIIGSLYPEAGTMPFMSMIESEYDLNNKIYIARCGYTGEDGYEIALPEAVAPEFTYKLLEDPSVEMAGLGARDCLRIEASFCLVGAELGPDITPVEAALNWSIRKRDLDKCLGGNIIAEQLKNGVSRKRVGIALDGKRVARGDTKVLLGEEEVGTVTSGTYSHNLDKSIAMAYIKTDVLRTKSNPDGSDTFTIDFTRNKLQAKLHSLPFVTK